MIISIK